MLRIAMQTLWPAFLVAIVAEGCFFSFFDVGELLTLAGHVGVSPLAGYTIGFFFFWVWIALGALLARYLVTLPPDHQPPF